MFQLAFVMAGGLAVGLPFRLQTRLYFVNKHIS